MHCLCHARRECEFLTQQDQCDLHHDFWILEYVIAMMGLTEIVRTRSGSFLKGGSSRRSFGGRRCSNDNLDHMAAAASGSNNLRGDKSLSSGHVTPTRRNSSLSSTRSNQLLNNLTHGNFYRNEKQLFPISSKIGDFWHESM